MRRGVATGAPVAHRHRPLAKARARARARAAIAPRLPARPCARQDPALDTL